MTRGQKGFTLIEVMIATAILALMSSLAWYTMASVSTSRELTEAWQERNHEIRVAMARMAADLESAYLSKNEDTNQQERRTLFVGKGHGDVDELRFSSMGHRVLWADANESEQTVITYLAESDRENPSWTNLLRREQRRVSNENPDQEPAEVDLLLRNIEKVSFEYWDWNDKEWRDTWDSTKIDAQRDRLPYRVRITVELEHGSDTVKYTTQARISMQEALQSIAN